MPSPLPTVSAPDAPVAIPGSDARRPTGAAIRRLSPRSFPELPAPIMAALEQRGCSVPQLDATFVGATRPHNVVRGRFGRGAEPDWAVLCSQDEVSTILVFWDGGAESPAELERRADASWLQDMGAQGEVFSRHLGIASADDILAFQRAYGGPEPPPLTHEGIADEYVEKGSVVLYWHDGAWLHLTGAD